MKLLIQVIITLVVAVQLTAVTGSAIYKPFPEELLEEETQTTSAEDPDDEPIFEPRFFGWFGGGQQDVKKVEEDDVTAALSQFLGNSSLDTLLNLLDSKNGSLQDTLLKLTVSKTKGNETLGKLAEVLKTSSYDELQEGLLNFTLSNFRGNESLVKIADVIQNSGNKTFKENLLSLVSNLTLSSIGGDETLTKIIGTLQTSGNKSLQENLLGLASDAVLSKLGNNTAMITNLVNVIKNPNNKTLQEHILNGAAGAALSQFGINTEVVTSLANSLKNSGNNQTLEETLLDSAIDAAVDKFGVSEEVINSLANILKNSGSKTDEQNLLNAATNAALSQFGDNEAIKSIAAVLKNSGNNTLEENILRAATDAALSQFGDNEAVKSIANALKNSGNKTLQENLLNVATEAALSKYGDNAAVKEIVGILKNPGNKTLQENLLSFATNAAKSKFANNAIIQSMVKVLEGNGTIQEKLSAATATALNTALGPVGAAVAKQGINVVGNVLKVGGGWFGGLLSHLGGNSTLGKIGKAVSGGSQVVGGFMNSVAGNKVAIATVQNPIFGRNTSTEHSTKVTNTLELNKALEASTEVDGGTSLEVNSAAEFSTSENIGNQLSVSEDRNKGNIVKPAGNSKNQKEDENTITADIKDENKSGKNSLYKSLNAGKGTFSVTDTPTTNEIKGSTNEGDKISKGVSVNKIYPTTGVESGLSEVNPKNDDGWIDTGNNETSGVQTNASQTISKQGQQSKEGIISRSRSSNPDVLNRQDVYQGGNYGDSFQIAGSSTSNSAMGTALEPLRAAGDSLRDAYESSNSYGLYGQNSNAFNRISSGGDQISSGQFGNFRGNVVSMEITTVKIQMG